MASWSDFISEYNSPCTVEGYEVCARRFFKFIYGSSNLESSTEKYFNEKRNYESDVREFFVSVKETMAPKTVQMMLAVIKALLIRNRVELPQSFWKSLGKKMKYRAISVEKVPSKEEMRQILTHMRAKGRALYLMLISSGMRINEALSITLQDIDLQTTPTKINIRSEIAKGGQGRISFISLEATEALKEWLKIRDKYLKSAVAQSTPNTKSLDDNCIFPFSSYSARSILLDALDKAKLSGVDSRTKRSKIHPHVFRKYFRGAMGAVIQLDVVEALMGHSGYLTSVYRQYPNPEKTLAVFYLKGEAAVTIYGNNSSEELQEQVEKQSMTIAQQDKTIQQAMASIQSLTAIMAQVEFRLTKYESTFGFLKDYTGDLQEVAIQHRNEKVELEKEKRIGEQHEKHAKALEAFVNNLGQRGKK